MFIELVQSPATWKKVSAEYSMEIKNQLSDSDHRHRSMLSFVHKQEELSAIVALSNYLKKN